jgi:hypothetical protein
VAGADHAGKHRRCSLSIAAGRLDLNGRQGPNALRFQGRLSPTGRLTNGSYTVTFGAANTAGSAHARRLNFTIVVR